MVGFFSYKDSLTTLSIFRYISEKMLSISNHITHSLTWVLHERFGIRGYKQNCKVKHILFYENGKNPFTPRIKCLLYYTSSYSTISFIQKKKKWFSMTLPLRALKLKCDATGKLSSWYNFQVFILVKSSQTNNLKQLLVLNKIWRVFYRSKVLTYYKVQSEHHEVTSRIITSKSRVKGRSSSSNRLSLLN